MPSIGAPEIILIILVVVLLFGAKKLPELARGSGRALRIFKSETKGLMDDDQKTDPHGRQLPPGVSEAPEPQQPQHRTAAEQPTQDGAPRDSQR
jgi:sec-independent protein translocase protein TatA